MMGRMEIGISLSSSTRSPGAAAGRHLLEMARVAVDAGLASLSLGDHHVVGPPAGYLQNTPALGRLLAEWSPTGRPAGCLFLLPQWPPVLVAEQVGTLAALHDGPFIVQTGLGWAPDEFAAMGQTPDHRVSVFEEGVRVVRSLLAGETVSSERFGFADVAIGLVPEQPVDWWMGTTSEAGLRRAARFGAAWYAGPSTSADELGRLAEFYRAACDDHGTPARVMLRRDGIVLPDGERAHRLADDAVAGGYRGMQREHLFAGDPAEVAEQLSAWVERGVDQIVTRTMGLDDAHDLATIEGLGAVSARLGA
jgi:alkanesulfonate monooxygenase SsuD/methylene tetrahydromethanopterin reductase-like flavin-dependent oxidoreductase (luciferase family)